MSPEVSVWVLAGGEGRRVQGQDKGLLVWRDRPLVSWTLASLQGLQMPVGIIANRHLSEYQTCLRGSGLANTLGVIGDDGDLPARSGPMAGLLTALRHSHSPCVAILPCDCPMLAPTLVPTLHAALQQAGAECATACTTDEQGQPRHHWTCLLVRRSLEGALQGAFMTGERKIGRWVQTRQWKGVCLDDERAFTNMNSLETINAWL